MSSDPINLERFYQLVESEIMKLDTNKLLTTLKENGHLARLMDNATQQHEGCCQAFKQKLTECLEQCLSDEISQHITREPVTVSRWCKHVIENEWA